MANINVGGIDLTTGQERRLLVADTATDDQGNPIGVAGTLAQTLALGNETGANNIIVSSAQRIEGEDTLHLTAGGNIEITAPSSFNVYIGSDQGGETSAHDDTYIDAGNEIFIADSGGRTPDVTIGDSGGGNTVTIHGFDAPGGGGFGTISSTSKSSSIGETGNGLILVEAGGTKIGGLTGAPITLGPVYYNPQTGQTIRFGNSIFLDGDGTTNTINGGDGTQDKEEILTTLGQTDATVDVATAGPITDNTLTPGSVTIQVKLAASPTTFTSVTDDGAGAFASGAVFPAGGTITYATGALTGTTATLAGTSEVVAFYLVDNTAGEALTPRGGAGSGSAAGGPLNLIGGAGGATGAGGDATLTSGAGGSTSGASGDVNISVGAVTTPGTDVPGTVQVNSLPLPTVLASVASIDLTSTGTTTLFTVPAGRSVKSLFVSIRPTTATAAGADAIVSVGTNASTYDDIFSATTLTGLNATTEEFTLAVSGVSHISAATEVITFQVDTADTGTALTATVELIGYVY